MSRVSVLLRVALALALLRSSAGAQDWRETAAHVGTTARVLIVGTRPEDEDNALIAWLSLGRHVETAYLSLTRGESGVNVAGTERQAALAVVRTAELLAERERDGAHQYFTRAYDFGPTTVDSIVETSWPHDSLLKDVVSVVRAFRPHVVISMFAEGERDVTRRLAARLTAEAFNVAADTARMPSVTTSRLPAWAAARLFTRVGSATPASAHIVAVDVGEFDRNTGRSYAEIGAEIRRLQRSQPAPTAPAMGIVRRELRLDSTRVGDGPSLFGALDTTLSRFHAGLSPEAQTLLDSLRLALNDLRALSPNASADSLAARLARVSKRTSEVRLALSCRDVEAVPACPSDTGDLAVALNTIRERATRAMLGAAGLVIDGVAARELVAAGDSVPVVVTVYNGGGAPVAIQRLAISVGNVLSMLVRDSSVALPPDSATRWSANVRVLRPSYHWWQINGLVSGTLLHDFRTTSRNPVVPQLILGEDRIAGSSVEATVAIAGVAVPVIVRPIVYRSTTSLRGDMRHPLAGVPRISVFLERTAEYERASLPIDRLFRVNVWSARSAPDTLAVTLQAPSGLMVDSATRWVAVPAFGARDVFFRLRGRLRPGSDTIFATARSVASAAPAHSSTMVMVDPVADFRLGVVTHEYPHIPSQQFVRFSNDRLEAVDARVPPRLQVAYVKGSGDVQTPLGQLQVKLQTLEPSLLSVVDLSVFSTVLIGADASLNDALAAAVPALNQFLRKGGTVVVLPGGEEVARSGLLPYPIAFDSVPARVSDPASDVHILDARARILNWPNAITPNDFANWTGDRARNVPAAFDQRYQTVLSTGDPHEEPTTASILIAHVGKGTIIYTALSLDQQLGATNPGAARLMINLLAAGLGSDGGK
jgi:LmbE family N-acetylglucosaminyl deacetylase